VSIVQEMDYILGHSQHETRRLMTQAAILRPITERLLRSTGIGQGMRVLDVGCGAGDVTMLAAELVGPYGWVVGIDRDPEVIVVAKQRAQTATIRQIEFKASWTDVFSDPEPFDLVVGRCVLIHQADPVEFIRAVTRLVRPGGVIAFHEITLCELLRTLPCVPLWKSVAELLVSAFRALPHHDASDRLIQHFMNAGLPLPHLFCEIPVGGGADSPFYAWITDTLHSLTPKLVQMGIAVSDQVGPLETLEGRLRDATVEACSQIRGPVQVCAWTRT
jgi:2-polyprenyl-3-methyl-5-hydroxy-6-metoxy-1,4-benzoquinol methylase